MIWGLLAIGALAVLLVGWIYNGLVSARLRTREAWSAIDVQLQRRASLIPNLVESVKGYATYERETLKRRHGGARSAERGDESADAARAQR